MILGLLAVLCCAVCYSQQYLGRDHAVVEIKSGPPACSAYALTRTDLQVTFSAENVIIC